MNINPASIVPSTRDFLQAIATRRKCLALVPLVERADDAHALADSGVAAFAIDAVSETSPTIGEAIEANPLLVLAPIRTSDDSLAARAVGADAVVVEGKSADSWETVARSARSTRMAPLARVTDVASATAAAQSGAKAVYVKVKALSEIAPIMSKLGSLRVVAHVPAADEKALRALRGVVDAAIVESDLFLSTTFGSLREELDP